MPRSLQRGSWYPDVSDCFGGNILWRSSGPPTISPGGVSPQLRQFRLNGEHHFVILVQTLNCIFCNLCTVSGTSILSLWFPSLQSHDTQEEGATLHTLPSSLSRPPRAYWFQVSYPFDGSRIITAYHVGRSTAAGRHGPVGASSSRRHRWSHCRRGRIDRCPHVGRRGNRY